MATAGLMGSGAVSCLGVAQEVLAQVVSDSALLPRLDYIIWVHSSAM